MFFLKSRSISIITSYTHLPQPRKSHKPTNNSILMGKFYYFLGILLFHCTLTFAQPRQILGKVLDAKDKSPLAGVTVSSKGSKATTVSGADGSFSIRVNAKATALHFSYIGFDDQEVAIGNPDQPLVISLTGSQKALNEVVVVGYGKAMKRDVTGAITQISGKEVENFPAPSFESAIQGKASGVVVTSGSGKLGQAIQVNIRGISSISAKSQPLYVVDGLPIITSSASDGTNEQTNPLTDINPNDIESIEILKDASAAAIYGARAGNGVVLVTTKKGRNGQKTTIELNTSHGVSNPARKMHFLNAKQYVDLMEKAGVSDGTYDFNNNISGYTNVDDAIADYKAGYEGIMDQYSLGTDWRKQAVNTDWQAALFHHNAPTDQINLSASGGNDKTRFFVSGFYNTQQAIVINNKFSRYGARFNIDHNASDRLLFGINLAVDRSQLDRVSHDNAFSTPGQLVAQLPISPYLNPRTGLPNDSTLYANGIFDALYNSDKQVTFRTIGNAYGNFKILPSLSFQSEFGTDILNLNETEFAGKESQDGHGVGRGGVVLTNTVSFNTNNYFTFTPALGDDHKLTAVGGMSYLQNDYQYIFADGEQYPSDAVKNLSGATNILDAGTTNERYTFLSYFLRANYTYRDKFLLSVSDRIDGSSRFSPSHRYGNFPAVSAGWILSEENFLKGSRSLSFLKLRASYGLTGNSEIGETQYQSLYAVTNYPSLPGFSPKQLNSPNLRWEKSAQADIGLNFGFLKNRITGEIDYYHKHTTDLLLNTNIPVTTGYYSSTTGFASIYNNLGELDNKGFELTLTSQNLTGAFRWTTTFNLSYNKNKVGNIGGQIIESSDGLQRAIEGQPIGIFFMKKMTGVDPQTGDAVYALDDKGGTTHDYDSATRMVVGKYTPNFTGGLTNTFSYKGVDLSFLFYFVTGNNIYNYAGPYMSAGFYNSLDNQTTDMLNAWTTPGQKTNIPRIGYYGAVADHSSRYLYKGDYLRLKNMTLGYSIPAGAANALKIKSARIYVSGVNLLTFAHYPGDPEVNTNVVNNIAGGEDFYTIPQAKTFTVGLNVKF